MDTNCVMDFGIGLTQIAASMSVRTIQTSSADFSKCLSDVNSTSDALNDVKADSKPEPVVSGMTSENTDSTAEKTSSDGISDTDQKAFETEDDLKSDDVTMTESDDSDEISIPNEIMCAMMPVGLVTELVSFVAESLGIEPAELEGMIDEMGIDFSGLTDMDNLSQLILKATGQDDLTVFITDESFENRLSEMTEGTRIIVDDFMKELQQSSGIEETEEEPMNAMELLRSVFSPERSKQAAKTDNPAPEISPETVNDEEQESIPISIVREAEKDQNGGSLEDGEGSFTGLKKQSADELKTEDTKDPESVKTENPFDQFIEKLTEASKPEDAAELDSIRQMREIVYQIVEQIKVNVSKDLSSMEMKLNPENLGRVGLTLTNREGVMTARFVTETQEAKDAISSQMQILIENIEEKGVRVEAVEVTIGNFNFNMNENAGGEGASEENRSRGHRFIDDSEITGNVRTEEADDAVYMSVSGSTVSYRV